MKRTKLLFVFAIATVGLFGALTTQAYAAPSYSLCTNCHATGSGTSVTVTLESGTTATYDITVGAATFTGWAVYNGSTKVAYGVGATGTFTGVAGTTYTVYGGSGALDTQDAVTLAVATVTPVVPTVSYTVTATAGLNGSINPSGATTVAAGGSKTFTITGDSGYAVADVLVDGTSVGATSSVTLSNVAANHTISATFKVATYHTITATAGANGTISPSGSVSVVDGSSQTFTITGDSGYAVADVLVDGTSVGATNSVTFSNVTDTHTISATFEVTADHTITASAGSNGSISPSGNVLVADGGSQKFTITPDSGYQVAEVFAGGESVGAATSYLFEDVTEDATISATFEAITADTTYTITSSAGLNGSISPIGDTEIAAGDSQTYAITADSGFEVADVLVDGVSVGAVSSYTFDDLAADHTISVSFEVPTTYTIAASAGSNGSISPDGTQTVTEGSSRTFTITPDTGYAVSDVTVDGVSVGAATSYTFDDVETSHTISATFAVASSHSITASAGSNGTISPSGSVSVANGGSQKFTITPDSGYVVSDVLVDGESVGAASTYLFDDVTADHAISVTFEAATAETTHTITSSAALNGSISPSGDQEVIDGESQTYSITPDSGYVVSDVLVDGESVGAVSSYTFSDVTDDHTISASFELATYYTISASAGASGTISPSGDQSVIKHGSQTFTITPDSGCVVSDVLVDGTSVGALSTYTFSDVDSTHTISASFKAATYYTITASAGASGTISPSGDVSVIKGGSQKFTITPNSGYQISDVLVDGDSVGAAATYKFDDVEATHTISVTFEAATAESTHTITASAGLNGSISPSGDQEVIDGESQTFTITPDSGYAISDVLVDGDSVGATSSVTFSKVTADHTISASFDVAATYTITATAGSNGSVSPSGATTVTEGDSQTYAITANSGYHVSDVLVDGTSVGAVSSYTFSDLKAGHTISATFAADPVITASAGSNGSISPSGAKSVTVGARQKFTITPSSGYQVSDVLVDGESVGAVSSYTFIDVTGNHTISVTFAATPVVTYTITPSAGANGSISPATAQTVTSGASKAFTFTPNSGYQVSDVLVDGTSVGAVSSYTFTKVAGDHTISVTFKATTTVTTSLTIHRSGSSYKHGKSVTISGKLIGGLPSHTKVKLRVRRGTSGAYTYITGYTTSSGSYSFKKKLTNKGKYYFRVSFAGTTGYSSSVSSQLTVTSK